MNIFKLTITTLLIAVVGVSQGAESRKLPIDPEVRIGKLDNSLTYH